MTKNILPESEVLAQNGPGLLLPQGLGMKKRAVGHKLVVKVAREMAHEIYESCASADNEWYKQWPSRETYVERALPLTIPMARATLTDLMVQTKDESLKAEIYEALCLDRQFEDRIVA
jgi:hypothetical protein